MTKKKRKNNYGTGSVQDDFSAADRKFWMYIGNVKNTVSKENIVSFLDSKEEAHINTFECEELKTLGKNKSFKVGVTADLKNKVFENEFWPKGIIYRPYKFFRVSANKVRSE